MDRISKRSTNGILVEKYMKKNLASVVVNTYNFDALSKAIEVEFHLICNDLTQDITDDQMFKDCKSKKYNVSLGFGEWFPFIVLSNDTKSNQLLEEIFVWLQTIEIPTS